MKSSQKNNMFIVVCLLFSLGCAISRYHAIDKKSLGTDIEVTPDRIILQCEFITDYEGEHRDPYGFMIHLLDNEKTVLTVSNSAVLEKNDCLERYKIAERIIKGGKMIFVRGRGDAYAPIKMGSFVYYFPKHGKFRDNGRSLNYLAIWNDKGQCYDAFNGSEKPCPYVE